MSELIDIDFVRKTYSGSLREKEDGTAVLFWTDWVANSWEEKFASIPLGMLRLAVLLACSVDDGEAFTESTAEAFSVRARGFLENSLSR